MKHEVDVAVIATGYDVVRDSGSDLHQRVLRLCLCGQTASMLNVTGKNSVHLSDSVLKEDGPGAYRGVSRSMAIAPVFGQNLTTKLHLRQMMYPGFPNMYVMLGHNVAPGHTSVMINIEVQANYIAQVVKAQLQEGSKVIEVKEEPTRRYME